jgi:hypothetical protein
MDKVEIRVRSIISTRQRDQSDQRKVLFHFGHVLPSEPLDAYHIHRTTRNGVLQNCWDINPDEAFLVGTGWQGHPSLQQSFTPTVDVASRVQCTYYASEDGVVGEAVVLLVNRSDDAFVLYEGQLLGHVELYRETGGIRHTGTNVDFNQ